MDPNLITLTIDGEQVTVPEGTTIMDAAASLGIRIPRLCYHPDLSLAGSCRVCIVDVKDMGFHMASCSVKVWPGMKVETTSPEIRRARRDIVELILDNHPRACQTCERDGQCELQNLSYAMGVRKRHFDGKRKRAPIDESSVSVVRDPEKCILCGRCVRVCAEVQGVYNLSQHGRGFYTQVGPAHLGKMDQSVCIQCGQCINVCPTASFLEKKSTSGVWKALANPDLHVVVQTAPSIRAAIGEGFGLPVGTPVTGKMVTALRRLGFEAVFDTNFGADLTIVEEAHEFIKRLKGDGPLPLITSCSPGWINFLEKFYPQLIPHASTCKSPMSMVSTLTKTYYAEQKGLDPRQIYHVAIMPCVAKKYEISRPEHFFSEEIPYTDAVLTTRELIWMIKCYGIDLVHLPEGTFDDPLGESTGGGDIFGTTGGVMEASLRMAGELLTGKSAGRVEFTEVRAVEGLRETWIALGETPVHVGVANGLENAKVLLDKVASGEERYHFIEVMACPGGCIGGGGQPYPAEGIKVLDRDLLARRAKALYAIDKGKKLRKAGENMAIEELYKTFLEGPGSKRAYELLHTHYHAREPRGIR